MERHEFRMDTRGVDRHNVSRRVKVLLGISLFLTGFGALGGTMMIVFQIREKMWKEIGRNFVRRLRDGNYIEAGPGDGGSENVIE